MDKIEICNMALSRIGVENIETLSEPSEPARVCKQFFDHARRVVLRRFPWTFATRRVNLALLPVQPEDYQYAYRYPASCVCLRKLYEADYSNVTAYTEYKLLSDNSGSIIYTDVPNACAEYTADITDCVLFDEQFCEALSWKLAAEMAFKLTGNMQLAQMAEQQYTTLFLDAVANNGDEQNVPDDDVYSYAKARF